MMQVSLLLALLAGSPASASDAEPRLTASEATARPALVELLADARRASVEGLAPTPEQRRVLRAAVGEEVREDAQLVEAVVRSVRACRASFGLACVRGLGDAGTAESLAGLAQLLGNGDGLDLFVLEALGRAAAGVEGPLPPSVAPEIRYALRAPDADLRRSAARAAGAVGDESAIPLLIELVEDEDAALAGAAAEALAQMTGLAFGSRRAAWERWFLGETEFLEHDLQRLSRVLLNGEPAARSAAVKAIASGRLGVDQRAQALVDAYPLALREGLALQILGGLQTLRSNVGRQLLESVQETDRRPTVVAAAERALGRLDEPRGRPVR